MIACESCHRHFRVDEVSCPFCARGRGVRNLVTAALGGAVTTIVLAACYGGVPDKATPSTGNTGDTGTTTTTPPTTGDTGTTTTTTTGGSGATTTYTTTTTTTTGGSGT